MTIDEELPTPTGMSPRRRTTLIAVGALIVLGLVAAGIARLVTHSTPQAAPTVTVAPSTPAPDTTPTSTGPVGLSKPPAVLPVLHRLTTGAIDIAHAQCPRLAPTCTTTGEAPAAVTAALRAAFAQAKHVVVVSDIAYATDSGPRLAYRRLSARAGRVTLTVEARATASDDGTGTQVITDADGNVVRHETVRLGLTIEVQASAPRSRYLDPVHLEQLAADPRLLAIG